MKSSLLHVVTAYDNVRRWDSRPRLYRQFEQRMLDSGVQLHTVELAYGHRPWIISEEYHSRHVDYIQVRCKTLLWHKENLLNIGLRHVPRGAQYIAWLDGDVSFDDPKWAEETVQALQEHPVIQPWSDAIDLGPHGEVVKHHKSFAAKYVAGEPMGNVMGGKYAFAHPGYAWAARRDFLEDVGGFIDRAILGSADHHMALAIIGEAERSIRPGITDAYRKMVMSWQERAIRSATFNLGVIDGNTVRHYWHGNKADRRYVDRWQILLRNHYDPDRDVVRNLDGVLELAGNKPRLARDLQQYFSQRNEDSNHRNDERGDGRDHGGKNK